MTTLKALSISLMAVGALSLTACGYQLRGMGENSLKLAPAYSQVNITTEDNALAYGFKHKLATRLAQLGVSTNSDATHTIMVQNLRYRRYELLGVLTEVRLLMMADVTYQINGKSVTYPIQVERSYQYNEAGVATSDQQGEQAQAWLQDNLAERIAEQYYAMSSQAAK